MVVVSQYDDAIEATRHVGRFGSDVVVAAVARLFPNSRHWEEPFHPLSSSAHNIVGGHGRRGVYNTTFIKYLQSF